MLSVMQVKDIVKRSVPGSTRLIRKVLPRSTVFWLIYRMNHWECGESRSGPGSTLRATQDVRRQLPELLTELSVTSMLDAACGDFHWMQSVDLPCDYVGSEIVGDLVKQLSKTYGNAYRTFIQRDICRDPLPKVDLVFCRDVTIHLPTQDVYAAIRNIKASGSKYLLITHQPAVEHNQDVPIGGWRAINFTLPPFSFPKPLRMIHDADADQKNARAMALWRLGDLPLEGAPTA